jgi:hypothetical protein
VTDIDTDPPADELEPALLAGAPPPEDEELLLQAAAARHRASDADAATAPFLTIEFINHLASSWEGTDDPHPGMREEPPGLCGRRGLSVFNHDLRTPGINVVLTSAPAREDIVNGDGVVLILIYVRHLDVIYLGYSGASR